MFGYGTLPQPGYYFSSPRTAYNAGVNGFLHRPSVLIAGALALTAATVALVLWILPRPHTHLQYLIAGTAGTGVGLGMLLAIVIAKWPAVRK